MAELCDREQEVLLQQIQREEAKALDHAMHYQALGYGLATMAHAMMEGLLAAEDDAQARFTRFEALWLVHAALQKG
jgi:hypothetical protein